MERSAEFLGLYNLVAPRGARKAPKRVGRGESSGHGKTCGRGNKGQKARKSGNVRIGFEGGQNPLARRMPKKGFKSLHEKFCIVNIENLSKNFADNAKIDSAALVAAGLVPNHKKYVKILGQGEPRQGFIIQAHSISKSAREKIEKANGMVEILKV